VSDTFVTWNVLPEEAWAALVKDRVDLIEADVVALIDGMTDEVTTWMRANHRWENRSGDAEAGLYADVEHVLKQSVHLLLSHGPAVEYAWFLEANPRYALLGDAADHFWPVLLRGVQEILRKHSD
jgi:hypothetical protein